MATSLSKLSESRCTCGALIVLATMERSGKRAPFELDADGEWTILDGIASHQGKAPAWTPPERCVPRWSSHFERCSSSRVAK
ncbi:MAG TPA: hypothetical protein VJU58_13805 [Microbacterium sp.]|nr:hypothetical protein [Microbacterium sp.]